MGVLLPTHGFNYQLTVTAVVSVHMYVYMCVFPKYIHFLALSTEGT